MVYVDIAQIVKDALIVSGCDPALIDNFDGHSTIALDFDQLPTIYVNSQGEDVWLWCKLTEFHENILPVYATALLQEQMKKLPYIRNHHLNVIEDKGYLVLSGLIEKSMTDSGAAFAGVLEGFLERAEAFGQIVK